MSDTGDLPSSERLHPTGTPLDSREAKRSPRLGRTRQLRNSSLHKFRGVVTSAFLGYAKDPHPAHAPMGAVFLGILRNRPARIIKRDTLLELLEDAAAGTAVWPIRNCREHFAPVFVAEQLRIPAMPIANSEKRRSGYGSRRRALRALFYASELSATIRGVLLADVLANLLQLEPYRGHCVAASPEVFAGEVPLLSAKPCNCNCALSFQETNHGSNGVFGRDRDGHVHVVHHQMPLQDLAFLLFRQRMENWTQLTPDIPEDRFPPSFGHEFNLK